MGRILLYLLLLAALGCGAAFSYFNADPVRVDWLIRSSEAPLGVLLVAAATAGFVLAALLFSPIWWLQRARVARLQKNLLRQSGELDSLRQLQRNND